jgi:hypothetical protein
VSVWDLDAERELLADACVPGRNEHALWNFVLYAAGWHFRCTEDGQLNWITERVHQPWLDWVQEKVMDWKTERRKGKAERHQLIICVPRGFGKSNIITKILPLWCMLDEPNISTYIGSETHPKAKAFLSPMKSLLNGTDPYSLFSWLYGNWYNPDRSWNLEEVVTAYRTSTGISEPSIGTFGVETGITSKHPLLMIYDDPVSDEKMIDGGNWNMKALESLDSIYPALRPDSMFILIGTRYRDDDPIGTSIRTEGVADWVGHPSPEKYKPGIWHVYFLQARDKVNIENYPKGEPILPESGWNNEALLRSERRNAQKYSSQMMNDPFVGDHMEITRAQIENLLIKRADLPSIEYATLHVDTAFKFDERRERGDRNAIVVWLHDLRPTGVVFLDRVLCSEKWSGEEFDSQLIRVLYDLRRRGIRIRGLTDEVEQGGKRGVYRQHLEQLIGGAGLRPFDIYQFNRSGSRKVIRIREAASYWLDGFVRLVDDAENLELLIDEMLKIGRSQFDDISDAASDVFRPEIWRGRQNIGVDEQPILPMQPGDDILKGNQFANDINRLGRDLFPEHYGPLDNEQSEPQPESEYERFQG